MAASTAWFCLSLTDSAATACVRPKLAGPPPVLVVGLWVTERGTVTFWHAEEGWGAVEVPGRSGIGFAHFAHFSHIQGMSGYRELLPGEPVEVEWGSDRGQDGCQWTVTAVRPIDRTG